MVNMTGETPASASSLQRDQGAGALYHCSSALVVQQGHNWTTMVVHQDMAEPILCVGH